MVMAVGAAMQEDPLVLGNAELARGLHRGHDHCRCLVDEGIGVQETRIREADPAVLLVDRDQPLGAVALATFENVDGLRKGGRNMFYQTMESGPAKVGMAQTSNRGSIWSSTLEESNVDIAQEFVNMILTQRAFQANSRSITTTDTMIEEVLNQKR